MRTIATVGLVVFGVCVAANAELLDDFESYALNTWPSSSGWTKDGNADGRVALDPVNPDNQALRLYGVVGSYWATCAYYPQPFPDVFTLEASVYNGSEHILGGGHSVRADIGMKTGAAWPGSTNPGRGLISFGGAGTIRAGDGSAIGNYETERWYDVAVRYRRKAQEVSLSYYFDDRYLGTVTSPIYDQSVEDGFDHINPSAQAGTVYFDDIRLSMPPAQTGSDIYGLFIGVKQTNVYGTTLRGDTMAENLHDVIAHNVAGFKDVKGNVLTADLDAGEGIRREDIGNAITGLQNAGMKAGDKLLFYSIAHGNSYVFASSNPETISGSPGDEYMNYGITYLSDDNFKDYFSELEQVEKWVLMDGCHSGGFWGNNNPEDEGDLEKLQNIALFAAAEESKETHYGLFSGLPEFGSALLDAFSLKNGHLRADSDEDGDLTFEELADWVTNPERWGHLNGTVVCQADFGEPVIFTPDMWSPVSFASPDFYGSLIGDNPAIPAPSAVLLGALGTGILGWLRRRKTL